MYSVLDDNKKTNKTNNKLMIRMMEREFNNIYETYKYYKNHIDWFSDFIDNDIRYFMLTHKICLKENYINIDNIYRKSIYHNLKVLHNNNIDYKENKNFISIMKSYVSLCSPITYNTLKDNNNDIDSKLLKEIYNKYAITDKPKFLEKYNICKNNITDEFYKLVIQNKIKKKIVSIDKIKIKNNLRQLKYKQKYKYNCNIDMNWRIKK
jgi:hypothetical protein